MHSLKVFLKLCDLNFKQLLIYRASFFITLVLMGFWVMAFVVLITVIFLHTNTLAGYSKGQVLLVMAFYYLFQNFSDVLFKDSFEQFGETINHGTLDFYLVKPAPARLQAFFRQMRFDHCAGMVTTGLLFWYAIKSLDAPLSAGQFSLGFAYSLLGTVLYWHLLCIISTFSFWVIKNDAFRGIIWNLSQVSRYPRQIYRGFILKFFTFVIPLTVLGSVPAEMALRMQTDHLEWYIIGLTLVFGVISKSFWEMGLKRYTSAS